jgi:excisionase family DNA binding protein
MMPRRSPQTLSSLDAARLPLEPLSVRISVAVQLTGICRSKIYELIASGHLETVKVGTSTLVLVSSLKRLIAPPKPD